MKTIALALLMMTAADAEELRVTLYNKAKIPNDLIESVTVTLSSIFRQSGINIKWVAGVPGAPEASLMTYQAPPVDRELEFACHARRDIAFDIIPGAVAGVRSQLLGMALPLSHEGLNVRIFYDHVLGAATKENRPYATVLSYAIAHEIGHVLLRSNAHAGRGLMAEVWTNVEYDWMSKAPLFFATEESRQMRATLSGAGCPAITSRQ